MSKSEKIGYARVSSVGQSLGIQEQALQDAGCSKIFAEKLSGTTVAGRDQLEQALDYCREGDSLIVTRLDRLARSLKDLLTIVDTLSCAGVSLVIIEQDIDSGTSSGKLMLSMLGAFAEFETSIRAERQAEGIAAAKLKGKYSGRPSKLDDKMLAEIKDRMLDRSRSGETVQGIADDFEISRQYLHRLMKPE